MRTRTPLVLVLVVCFMLPAVNGWGAELKEFSGSFTPATAPAGTNAEHSLIFTNSAAGTARLGSIDTTVPAGWTTPTGLVPSREDWTASVSSGVIQLRASSGGGDARLAPGESITLRFNSEAPCALGSYSWLSEGKQSNTFKGPKNDFTLTGAQPSLEVVPGAPHHLAFGTQPSDGLAGQPLTATVRAEDSCDNLATSFSGDVSVELGNAGDALLDGTTTMSATDGIAGFSNLIVDRSGSDYTLIATSEGLLPATSSAFSIVGKAASCHSGSCTVNDATSTTLATVTILECDSSCEDEYLTLDLNRTGNFCGGRCLGNAPLFVPPTTAPLTEVIITLSNDSLPNGPPKAFQAWKEGFEDPLPPCADTGLVEGQPGCLDSIGKTSFGDLTARLLFGAGDPATGIR